MNTLGYQRRELYNSLLNWWVGEGSLSKVEDLFGAKYPFLLDFFIQADVLDVRGFKVDGVTFQEAFNLFLLHVVMLGLKLKKR